MEGTSASNRATIIRIGRNVDCVGIQSEIGDKVTVAVNGEGVGGIRRHHVAVLSPVDEGVPIIGSSIHGA